MNSTVALSTCWNSVRHTDGYAMLREAADLGFSQVELSHGIRISLVPGIIKAVREGWIGVASTHNFCPLPAGITSAAPNLYMPSSQDSRERSQWLRHTTRSLDFAAQMKARAMVMHLGRAEFFWFNPKRKLDSWRDRRPGELLGEDPAYRKALEKACIKLRKRIGPFWHSVRAGLEHVASYAAEKGVRLGLENRESFDELPIDADFPELFAGMTKPEAAGYWHDTGHAQIKREMGLIDPLEQLRQHEGRTVGFHLHDVVRGADHQPIGTGTVDWVGTSRFFRPEHIFVLEFSPRLKPEQVTESFSYLQSLLPKES
jgi:sugar phosphate isomerase/epimerase